MTDRIIDGGPAFPQSDALFEDGAVLVKSAEGGMSLRDWFAGQALANPDICRRDDEYPQRTAYSFADAMLEARK